MIYLMQGTRITVNRAIFSFYFLEKFMLYGGLCFNFKHHLPTKKMILSRSYHTYLMIQ